jgi:hypothetical protein
MVSLQGRETASCLQLLHHEDCPADKKMFFFF